MTLADKLHLLLTNRRWTPEYLAMRAEISQPYMSYLLNGKRTNPSDAVLDRLAQVLEVARAYLAGTMTAGEQCDRDGSLLARDGTRWWCDVCSKHVIPLGFGTGPEAIERLMQDERRYQASITEPGSGSSSGGRKRSRKKGGLTFVDGPAGGRRDGFGHLPGRRD